MCLDIGKRPENKITNKSIIYGNEYVLIHHDYLSTIIKFYFKGTDNKGTKLADPIPRAMIYLFSRSDFETFSVDISKGKTLNNITKKGISNLIFGPDETFSDAIKALVETGLIKTRTILDEGNDNNKPPIKEYFLPSMGDKIDIEKDFDETDASTYYNDLSPNEFKAYLFLTMHEDNLIKFDEKDIDRWKKNDKE